jgi:hypothetical protein
MENSDVIEIDFINSEETCCLCLDDKCNLILKCCRNKMHSDCLFSIFLKNMFECPLCRKQHKPSEYFNIRQFYLMFYEIESKGLDFTIVDKVLLDICDKDWLKYYYYKVFSRLIKSNCGIYVVCCEYTTTIVSVLAFYIIVFSLITLFYVL